MGWCLILTFEGELKDMDAEVLGKKINQFNKKFYDDSSELLFIDSPVRHQAKSYLRLATIKMEKSHKSYGKLVDSAGKLHKNIMKSYGGEEGLDSWIKYWDSDKIFKRMSNIKKK